MSTKALINGWINDIICGDGEAVLVGGQCCGAVVKHTRLQNFHTLIYKHTLSRRGARDALLLPVVAELDGGAVEDAAEGDWLNFPVRHRVAEQADARVHGLLAVEARRTEVPCSHSGNLVGMEVDHLEKGFK